MASATAYSSSARRRSPVPSSRRAASTCGRASRGRADGAAGGASTRGGAAGAGGPVAHAPSAAASAATPSARGAWFLIMCASRGRVSRSLGVERASRSLELLGVDDVQVAREVLDAHLSVDLAAMHLAPRDERRIRLAPDGEGGG